MLVVVANPRGVSHFRTLEAFIQINRQIIDPQFYKERRRQGNTQLSRRIFAPSSQQRMIEPALDFRFDRLQIDGRLVDVDKDCK